MLVSSPKQGGMLEAGGLLWGDVESERSWASFLILVQKRGLLLDLFLAPRFQAGEAGISSGHTRRF